MTRRLLLFAILFALLSAAVPARAHGYLVRAIPADRAVLERAPSRVQYWFSEGLEPRFSTLRIYDQSGALVAEGSVPPENINTLAARLPTDLPDGAYVVDLRPTFASDGHPVAETRVFFVGAETAGVVGASASDQAVPLEVVWRALLYSSTALLLGVFALYGLILVPAWGNPAHPAGLLPPRVMTRLNRIVWGALAVAVLANLLALLQQTMTLFNADAITALREGYWQIVRIGSRFGDVWNWRMLFFGVIGAVHFAGIYYRREQPRGVRAGWTANLWLMMLVIGASSVASHAAGALTLPWLAVFVNWAHALATAFWVGGLAALVLVLPAALRPYTGDERRAALLSALNRFTRLATASVVVVVATGIYNALNWFYEPNDLATTYGAAQAAKTLLVIALLGVAGLQQVALHPALHPARFARFAGLARRVPLVVRDFSVTLRLETLLAAGVLSLAALLSATPPPIPDFLQQTVPPPTEVQTVNGLTVRMTLSPGGPGINTYDAVLTQDGAPVEDVAVRLQMINPTEDWRGEPQAAEPADGGLYVAVGDDLDSTGEWWTLVDVVQPDGAWSRAAFRWQIDAAASVDVSRPPSIAQVLALLGVLAALGYAFYPPLRRFYDTLNFNTTNVTVAVLATVGTLIALAGGTIFLIEAQRQAELALNPPPAVINSVLPDAESLARGEVLFTTACAGWLENLPVLNELVVRLPRLRDEALFAAVGEGWRGLPACSALTEPERWDVVNYVRTLGR